MWDAIIALVASAALGQINSNVVQNRQSREVENAMRRQREYQRQAEKIAMDNANDFQQDSRADRQNEIKQQLTEQYYKPWRPRRPPMPAMPRYRGMSRPITSRQRRRLTPAS